jgi:hypothetical protein
LLSPFGSMLDGLNDFVVTCAAAQISGESLPDFI